MTLAMLGEQATPVDTAAVLLSPDAFARAADAGRGLSVDEAVALALEIADGWTTGD